MAERKWAFLEPWRVLLRRIVLFKDHEELVVGRLHEQVCCVCVNLFHYEEDVDSELDYGDGSTRAIDTARRGLLIRLREALELVGLALHYDKRVWPWLRPEYNLLTFKYDDSSTFEPLFEFTFHAWWSSIGDNKHDFVDGLKLIAWTNTRGLSDAYHAAKAQLQDLVGARYDPEYRIPASIVLAPRALLNGERVETLDAWYTSVSDFLLKVRAPLVTASSCFAFKAVTLYGWQLRVDESLASMLSQMLLAQVQIPELSLRLTGAHSIFAGRV